MEINRNKALARPCVGEVAVKPNLWLNRHICQRAEKGWRVKGGEAGGGDFAKQNTTPNPLHDILFLLNVQQAFTYP